MQSNPTKALEDIIASCIESLDAGHAQAIEEACEAYPEFAEQIRAALQALGDVREHVSIGTVLAQPTRTVGRFEVIQEIGRGGAGVVYRARDPKLCREVAVKVFAVQPTPESLERFRREAFALASVRNAHIPAIHDVGETEQGVPYFAMDLIQGSSLESILAALSGSDPRTLRPEHLFPEGEASRDRFYVKAVVRMAVRLADSLEAAHNAGVIHRDVKPGNILIGQSGEPFLVDFGLARSFDASVVTQTGHAPGTPLYMAPEQVSASRGEVGVQTDVYALGVTLYHCLTLRAPFEGDTTQIFHQICSHEPEPPRRINPEVSRDLETIVLKAMEKDAGRRYSSAAALRDDLDALLNVRPIAARPSGPITKSIKWVRRHPARALAVALSSSVLILVLILVCLWIWGIIGKRIVARRAYERLSEAHGRLDAAERALAPREADLLGTYMTPEERGRVAAEQQEVAQLRHQVEVLLAQACDSAEQALNASSWLGRLNLGLRQDLFKALMLRGNFAAARGNTMDAERCRGLARSWAHDEQWALGQVTLSANPPETVVHLFRYEPYEFLRRSAIPRLVPVPIRSDGASIHELAQDLRPGDLCALIREVPPGSVAARAGLTSGDLIHRIGRWPVRDGGLYVRRVIPGSRAEQNGVKAFDRITSIGDKRILGPWDWETIRLKSGTGYKCEFESVSGRRVSFESDLMFEPTNSPGAALLGRPTTLVSGRLRPSNRPGASEIADLWPR